MLSGIVQIFVYDAYAGGIGLAEQVKKEISSDDITHDNTFILHALGTAQHMT